MGQGDDNVNKHGDGAKRFLIFIIFCKNNKKQTMYMIIALPKKSNITLRKQELCIHACRDVCINVHITAALKNDVTYTPCIIFIMFPRRNTNGDIVHYCHRHIEKLNHFFSFLIILLCHIEDLRISISS